MDEPNGSLERWSVFLVPVDEGCSSTEATESNRVSASFVSIEHQVSGISVGKQHGQYISECLVDRKLDKVDALDFKPMNSGIA